MRRHRGSSPSSPYRALAAHQAQNNAGQQEGDVSSLLRSFNVETNPTRPMRPSPLTASTIPDMPLDLVDRIRSFPLFMSAPDEFLAAIGAHLRPQIHTAHDHILTEGDDAKAMYWLVRGVVAVTSRDGEAVYAELKPGAFFGEIGVLMNIPRTATIVARTKCLLVVLKKEDLHAELPRFPEMGRAIRHEAQERLNILKKKQQERTGGPSTKLPDEAAGPKAAREPAPGEVSTGEVGAISKEGGTAVNIKKRKSPSPGVIEDPAVGGSALGSGLVNIRKTLKELPLFSELPPDVLHFLGLSAVPRTYPPFTDIVVQGSPGNDIFFIVRGEAEVIHEPPSTGAHTHLTRMAARASMVRPRLKPGQYFGEVASLGLSPGRTATVRSITTVECLVIGGEALDELWKRCPPVIRAQVEETARRRYAQKEDGDIAMHDDAGESHRGPRGDSAPATPGEILPQVTFTTPSKPSSPTKDEVDARQPTDPDPFLSVNMENMRNRRRNSLAPPTPQSDTSSISSSSSSSSNGSNRRSMESSPLKLYTASAPSPPYDDDCQVPLKRARTLPHRPATLTATSSLPDEVLVNIFNQLDVLELLRLRQVCASWRKLLATSPGICNHVDLSPFNRYVTDRAIADVLAPFIGERPISVDISNCFHVTDDGFQALWRACGRNVKTWRMRSVWEVSAAQILDMSEHAKGLEEIDWSNCRKVSDNLLARVVGWVVPEPPPERTASAQQSRVVIASSQSRSRGIKAQQKGQPEEKKTQQQPAQPPPGTVIGCPNLKHLTLSYCKHITDRSMAHLAAHASQRLESLSLTRCTSVTDAGFQSWAPYRFPSLTRLCLADCTYLSDNAVVALVSAAKNLRELDLSFCCALSDTATEVIALGLPRLRELRLAFCGSAVSDASLGCVALHLNELRGLSVRGCVRVTGVGVENVLEGCGRIEWIDVSQCKNLAGWLHGGGIGRWGVDARGLGSEGKLPAVVAKQPPSQYVAGARSSIGLGMAYPGMGMLGGPGPMMKPVVPPGGVRMRTQTRTVKFVVEKGAGGLR